MGWSPFAPADIPVDPQVAQVIAEILQQEVGRFGFDRADVSATQDHDGDPCLSIHAYYHPTETPIDIPILSGVMLKLRNQLWAMGERRFPHTRHHIRDDAPIAGENQIHA